MTDPNVIYKEGFARLSAELGKVPTTAELLPLHEAYKRAWGPAEETLLRPGTARAAGPGEEGFSRQPAPQAGAIDAIVSNAREADIAAAEVHVLGTLGKYARRASGGPRINAKPVPESEPPVDIPGLRAGSRGPGGGLVLRCHACGQLWERGKVRGRPSFKCGECR